jgi:hypothetical protein
MWVKEVAKFRLKCLNKQTKVLFAGLGALLDVVLVAFIRIVTLNPLDAA